jgi:hypothetical protein
LQALHSSILFDRASVVFKHSSQRYKALYVALYLT